MDQFKTGFCQHTGIEFYYTHIQFTNQKNIVHPDVFINYEKIPKVLNHILNTLDRPDTTIYQVLSYARLALTAIVNGCQDVSLVYENKSKLSLDIDIPMSTVLSEIKSVLYLYLNYESNPYTIARFDSKTPAIKLAKIVKEASINETLPNSTPSLALTLHSYDTSIKLLDCENIIYLLLLLDSYKSFYAPEIVSVYHEFQLCASTPLLIKCYNAIVSKENDMYDYSDVKLQDLKDKLEYISTEVFEYSILDKKPVASSIATIPHEDKAKEFRKVQFTYVKH